MGHIRRSTSPSRPEITSSQVCRKPLRAVVSRGSDADSRLSWPLRPLVSSLKLANDVDVDVDTITRFAHSSQVGERETRALLILTHAAITQAKLRGIRDIDAKAKRARREERATGLQWFVCQSLTLTDGLWFAESKTKRFFVSDKKVRGNRNKIISDVRHEERERVVNFI